MKAEQIKALLRAHHECDDEQFYAIGLQIAASFKSSPMAHDFLILVEHLRSKPRKARALLPANFRDDEHLGIVVHHPEMVTNEHGERVNRYLLHDMALTEKARRKAQRFLDEWLMRDALAKRGLRHKRTLLLYGPPGNGKTMLAHAIAAEMDLPLCLVRFDVLIASYLGVTANKLNKLFEFITRNQGVLFIDEFDTVAGDRSRPDEYRETSGEMRRTANTLLQCLDSYASENPVICATNLENLIDAAIWRRFDEVIEMPGPDYIDAFGLIVRHVAPYIAPATAASFTDTEAHSLVDGKSCHEIVRACNELIKTKIITFKVDEPITHDEVMRMYN